MWADEEKGFSSSFVYSTRFLLPLFTVLVCEREFLNWVTLTELWKRSARGDRALNDDKIMYCRYNDGGGTLRERVGEQEKLYVGHSSQVRVSSPVVIFGLDFSSSSGPNFGLELE